MVRQGFLTSPGLLLGTHINNYLLLLGPENFRTNIFTGHPNHDVDMMWIREALIADIPAMQVVRNAVKENRLSDPRLVTDAEVEDYITRRGKGWVCIINKTVAGFAIVSLLDKNVWALFVHPENEKKGIGKKLHDEMMNWYFSKTSQDAWLSTAPRTRAEAIYHKAGWREKGLTANNEIRFEMSKEDWVNRNRHGVIKA